MANISFDKILNVNEKIKKVYSQGTVVWSGENILFEMDINTTTMQFSAEGNYHFNNASESNKKTLPAGVVKLKYINNTGKNGVIRCLIMDVSSTRSILEFYLEAGENEYVTTIPQVNAFYFNLGYSQERKFLTDSVLNNMNFNLKIVEA